MFNNSNNPQEADPRVRFKQLLASLNDEETQPGTLLFDTQPDVETTSKSAGSSATQLTVDQAITQPADHFSRPVIAASLTDTQPIQRKGKSPDPLTGVTNQASTGKSSQSGQSTTMSAQIGSKPASFGPTAVVNSKTAHQSNLTSTGARKAPPPPSGRDYQLSSRPKSTFDVKGCLLRSGLIGAFVVVTLALCAVSLMFYQYYRIASQLPDISDLRNQASQFETTRILDRNGNELYEILDPNAGRRTYVPLSRISPYLVAATIATEDKSFYSHPGFDLTAIFRAFLQNYQSGEIASGASTITQQLSRALLFTPEEQYEQSYRRKLREAILAAEITRRYSKDEILELYLNENYFGNLAYGVEAAAETYFGTTADKITLSQAAFIAGLPQAPSIYDVYTNPEAVFERQEDVLVLMYQASQEQGCIFVSNSPQRICLSPLDVTNAANEIKSYPFTPPTIEMVHPHWVNYVRSLLESQFDAQTIYRSGFSVYTTLDPDLQELAETAVKEQVDSMAGLNAHGGALVAIRPNTGEILAMVGSPDFYNEQYSGQVNMAINPRQPGSSIKPLTYIAAFEKGWTPATLIWDVPSEFSPSGIPDDPSPPYIPVNYDGRFHGPVTVRYALANSYNIPAVKTLDFIGIYDDPNTPAEDGFLPLARRMGISTLNRPDYGLSLTLGGGEVTLLDLTGAYSILANGGRRISPVAITKILDHQGNLIYEYKQSSGEQVVRPEHAFLISSILSDNEARIPAFGQDSLLRLPFPAAVKTGTTNDFRDNWTIGYSPDLAVGVWIGNPDFTPMQNTSGLTGAAPIWSGYMQEAIQRITAGTPTPFTRPAGIVETVICDISGTLASDSCPTMRSELFAANQPPLPKEQDLWQKVEVDTWTGLLSSPACRDFTEEVTVLNVKDPWARQWIKKDEQGRNWAEQMGFELPVTFAPDRECRLDDPRPFLAFTLPRDLDTIQTNPLSVIGVADATDWYDLVRLEYGMGEDPLDWNLLDEWNNPVREPNELYSWDLLDIPPGMVTLRLYMSSTEDTYAEILVRINLQVPTPTPTPTATPTQTPLPTFTPLPTYTPLPTETPFPTETPTLTPAPTADWFPKATPTP